MLIISIASVSASDVSEICDNQDSNILNSYDSVSGVSASDDVVGYDSDSGVSASDDVVGYDSDSGVSASDDVVGYDSDSGVSASDDSNSYDDYSGSVGSSGSSSSSSDMGSADDFSSAGSNSSASSTNSIVSNDDGNSIDSKSTNASNSNSYKISSNEKNSTAEDSVSSLNKSKSSLDVKTPTKLSNSGKSVVKGNKYYVTLRDSNGNALVGKTVKLIYCGKTFKKTTNSKGIVSLKINSAAGKKYKLIYKFAGGSKYAPSNGSVYIKVKMATKFTGAKSSIVKGNRYAVTLKNSNGKVLSHRKVIFTINGKSYKRTTNSKGVARLKINLKSNRTYELTYRYDGSSYYGNSSKTVSLFVKTPTKLSNSGKSLVKGNKYYVTLKDSNGNALVGKTVKLIYRGKIFKKTTNSKGIVSLKINSAPWKTYNLIYKYAGDSEYGSNSGSANIKVKKAAVISSSSSSNITKGTAYKAVLKDSNGNPLSNKYVTFTFNGKNYTRITNSKGVASLTINAGAGKTYNLSYKYAGSRYYGSSSSDLVNLTVSDPPSGSFDNISELSYSSVTKKANASQYKKGINEIANLSASELKAYLSSSGHDSLNSAIKSLANSLVSSKTTDWAKAQAIFNFVRDKVSYSFYANSKKGASGTLSSKSANCCDQANLVVALCRAANIPARFSHGQGCTFSSGLVTGHVWAQIYVDGVWYSADATSSRNSLGNIKNWNVKSFYSLKQYAHLSF